MWRGIKKEVLRLAVVSLLCLSTVTVVSGYSMRGSEYGIQGANRKNFDRFYQQLETQCPNVRDTFPLDENVMEEMQSCIVEKLDMPAFKRTLERARDQKARLDAGFGQICSKWPALQVCIKPMTDAVKKCAPEGEAQFQAFNRVIAWICDNRARFINLFVDGGGECYIVSAPQFQSCALDFVPAHPTNETCKVLVGVQNCADAEFAKCKDPNLVPDLIQQVSKAMECGSASAQQLIFHGWYFVSIFIFVKNSWFL